MVLSDGNALYGLSLREMQELAWLLDGTIKFNSMPGHGTIVAVRLLYMGAYRTL
jgi:signal transduction histidine kinase